MSAVITILFLGGWLPPADLEVFHAVPGVIWFGLKMAFVIFLFVWVRATFPRFRYDQLMRIGWKIFLPFSLIAVIATSGILVYYDMLPK
jgi:NADH-quinone oxidoreductase subunit H